MHLDLQRFMAARSGSSSSIGSALAANLETDGSKPFCFLPYRNLWSRGWDA